MRLFGVLIVFVSLQFPLGAEDWAQFRGPRGNGITVSRNYPTDWGIDRNVRWSVDLPQPGNGSAIVSDNKVLVCSAVDTKGLERSLFCFDSLTGKQLWVQNVSISRAMPTHKTNPYGGSTPASDGQRVVVWHASAGLHAYSMDGAKLWSRDLGEFQHMWGYGSSPIIIGDRVFLNSGAGKQVFVAAFDVSTGNTIWRHDEPVEGDGDYNNERKYMGTWSTPIWIKRQGRGLVVVAMQKRILGLDAETGEVVWFFVVDSDRGDLSYSSPMVQGDVCLFNAGFKGPFVAFKISGIGDLAGDQLWRSDNNPQSIGTGVIVDQHVYRPGAGPNLIDCTEIESGKSVWQHRTKGAFWSSISLSGDVAYATDQRGSTTVFRPSPTGFIELGECQLDDTTNATPALANGNVFLRTSRKLWCIGESQ